MKILKTIDKYILANLMKSLIVLTLLVVGVVWVSQSLRFLELIVNNNVGIQSYFYLVLFLIPDLFSMVFPFCLLISGIQIYQKMIADHEIAVLRSTGYSNFQIARPFLMVCFLATLFSLYSNIFLIPESFKKFRSYEHQIRNELSASVIKPGTFNLVKGIMVYVKERSSLGHLKGVFIYAKEDNEKNGYVIAAEDGTLKKTEDELLLILKNGSRQEWDHHKNMISSCGFETFSYDLKQLVKEDKNERNIKPMERSLRELLNQESSDMSILQKRRFIAEAHQRIIMPFLCLLNGFTLMGCLLYGDLRRRQRKRKIFYGVFSSVSIQLLLIALINASTNNPLLIGVSYVILGMSMLFFGGLLIAPASFSFFKR